VEIDLASDRPFNRIDIREEGHEWDVRTKGFELLYREQNGDWVTLDRGGKIGHTYSLSFPTVAGRYIRLVINEAGKIPHFSELQIYHLP
jgi:hypothetical protein